MIAARRSANYNKTGMHESCSEQFLTFCVVVVVVVVVVVIVVVVVVVVVVCCCCCSFVILIGKAQQT